MGFETGNQQPQRKPVLASGQAAAEQPPPTKSGARAGGRRLSDRRLHRCVPARAHPQRLPTAVAGWGCPRIARQIGLAFDIQIDKDVVHRVLATHYRPGPGGSGPSWLTFLGHTKDSLWSMDLFRCESAVLRSHWVLVVMDQYTRRIVGFGVHAGIVDGRALCRMFSHAMRGPLSPTRLSADHDPLYRFHQWHANLRVLRVTEVKSVPYVPVSHPFVERLIGTLRRECVDRMLFWSASDLERKLEAFQDFYNVHRAHAALEGRTPVPTRKDVARLDRYGWQAHCRGLYQTPIAA